MHLSGELILTFIEPIAQHSVTSLPFFVMSCHATQPLVVEQAAQQAAADLDGASSGFHFFIVSGPFPCKQLGRVGQGHAGSGGEKGRVGNTLVPDACSLSPVELRNRLKAGEVRLGPKQSEPQPRHSGRVAHPVGMVTQDSTMQRVTLLVRNVVVN